MLNDNIFFSINKKQYDVIYDRAALIAINKSDREKYGILLELINFIFRVFYLSNLLLLFKYF